VRHLHRASLSAAFAALIIGTGPVRAQTAERFGLRPDPTLFDSASVERLADSLPLRARVAQLVMPWIPGNYAAFDDSAFTVMQGWVDSLEVGGIIVSVGSPLDVAMKLNRLQQRSRFPLLIAADFESGTSIRLTGGTPFPSNMAVAAGGREQDAYEVGRVTALEGRSVGVRLAFAPVADINNNPVNPIINTRSFGQDPAAVGRFVAAAIRGMQEHGMLATAKHFPGHGDTETDSHLALPVIGASWSRFDSLELVPFRAAIDAGVAFVMSGHLTAPALASVPGRPATLDPGVMGGVLRDSLHFHGLVVTDALEMGGIVGAYGAAEAAVLAFEAGADLLLQPTDPRAVIDAMVAAVESGRISEARLDHSVRRLLLLKYHLGLFARREVPLDSVPDVVGSGRFLDMARDIAQRSLVLAVDSLGSVDSIRSGRHNIALVTYGEDNAGSVGATLNRQLREAGNRVSLFRLWPASGKESFDSARAVIRRSEYTVFLTSVKVSAWKGSVELPDPVAELIDKSMRRRNAVLVSLGSPYIGLQVPHLRSYLIAWDSRPLAEWAVGRALTGAAAITGHLPVSIPPDFPVGTGLQRPDQGAE
jgi:beta-N-acetylhexosaminidase